MAQEDNLHKLYINLTDDGYNLGTEDEFRKQLQNKATAEKFHQNMVDDGYQLGSFDEFVSMNGLSYQMPQSQLPADQVERRVHTARVPQPGERIEATHVDKDGNVLQTDTTQLVRGKVATVEIGTPQFTPPSSHEGEELARRNGYYNTKESLDDSFSYSPNEYGEMRYGWQRGQRIKQLNRTGLEFMNRTGAYDENYDQAASQAEKMSDAQLVAEFNKLSGQIADAEALAGTADGYAMATVLRAYSHELRARDIGFAHGSENKKGIGQYQAAKQDPAVAAEILKQEAMSPEQRKAYLANAYKHIMAGEEGAPDIAMLAGTMIHAKESGIFPEEAYSQVVGIINNEHAEDVLAGALQSADAEIERLSQLIEQRTQQLYAEDEAEGMSLAKVMQHAESGSGAPIFNQRLLNDPELSMLWTAKRAAERRKKVIERKQDNHGFMRQFIGTFWDTATDINTWDFGIQDMRDAVNLVSFGNNKGSNAPMERAREAMLQNTVDAQEAEQRWRLSAAQRWGVIGGQALPFVAEFIGTGGGFSGVRQGVTKGVTSFLEKSLGKAASSKAAQWLVRSTGMLTGDIASALLMANTTGSMKTYADILDRKTGDLMQLYDGTFVFRNSTTMGDAILKGEVANTLEYYTEMLGNHLDGLISGAGKRLGLSRLSEGMKWLTGRQIQQLTTNVLRQGGINELPSEILEEEANLILNAMLVGDNNFDTGPLKELANKFGCNFEVDPNSEDYQRSIFNPEMQADIWGGMLFSIGAMRAPSVVIGTVGQGWNAAKQGWNTANYYYYKHKTDLAGTKLNGLVGGDELLDRINNTTNEQIPSLVAGILADDDFTPDMKSLAMDYIGNLVKERGYNVRMFDNAKDLDPEQDQEEGETVDLSYQEGYNAADEEQAGVKERVDVARAWLYNLGFDDSNIESLGGELPEAWLAALSDEQREAVEEYTNAMAAYEGMVQHVQDDMEGAIAESEAAVDQRTHIETGAVHHAVLKTGGEVWVVGGNVALTPEGNIDIENSDGDLIVLDPATGGKRMIHVSDLASADEPVMADQLKQQAAADIQETMATEAANRIDGVLPFQPGDVYSDLPFGEEQHTIQVIADGEDGVNVIVSVDGGEQTLMPMQMIQEAADAQREARIAEQAAVAGTAAQPQPTGQEDAPTEEPTDDEASQSDAIPEQEAVEEKQPDEDAMPMNGDEVDWFATSPERGHRFLYDEAGLSPEEADAVVANSVKDAEKELEKVSKKAPKPGNAAQLNKYRAEKAAHEQQVAAAQAAVDYWKGVQAVQQQIQMDAVRAQAEERAARDAAERQAAIEAEEQYQAEQAAKAQEQAERGPGVVGAAVTEKWNAAPKTDGVRDQIKLADGTAINGHYVLVEAGAATPSHDPQAGWKQSDGFPVNENGGTVNDRDYERDQAAQDITREMARTYDSRAVQTVPVVSADGVVLSGNGRTIAGDLAAQAGTDGAYIDYLREFGGKYGFTADQVGAMQHPRVLFVPDEAMPYTPETFARFNAQEMKGQNLTESAVKLGKTVDDATFNDVVGLINQFDTMGDFYAHESAPVEAINKLRQAGVINAMQYTQMFDGDKVSGQGKEVLENMLLGKAFEGNPDAIRQLMDMPSVRRQVVVALAEIANNSRLGQFSLEDLLSQSIDLVYKARNAKNKVKQGESVLAYAQQLSLFPDITGSATVADINNTAMVMIADILNDHGTNTLKYVLTRYNYSAGEAIGMAGSLFIDESPEGILQSTIEHINKLSNNELKQEINAAVEQRKSGAQREADSGQEAANAGAGSNAEGEARGNDGRGSAGSPAGREPGSVASSEEVDENGIPFVKAADGTTVFGEIREESGLQPAPIRLSEGFQDADGKGYGLAHIEANHGEQIRSAGFSSVEEFVEFVAQNYDEDNIRVGKRRDNGNTTYLIQVQDEHDNTLFIEMSRDGSYWNVNSAGIFRKGYSNKKETVAKTEPQQPNNAVSTGSSLSTDAGGGITPAEPNGEPTVSTGKGSTENTNVQGNSEKNVEAAVADAEAEVDTEPTDGQKEAGNYKKGHVKIDGFDVTIEQPKGSVRSGVDASGKPWSQEMHNTYGYIRGTEGVDGDHIDVFLSDHLDNWNGMVYVVDQVNKDGSFDEHKVMYGFDSEQEARDAYLSNYEEGWTGLGNITGVTRDEFRKWVDSSHRKTKPFAEYKSVRATGSQYTDNGGAAAAHGTGRTIQGLEDYSEEEILRYVREFFDMIREDNDADAEIVDVRIIGSRARGDADVDSDLDILLEYRGSEREDDMFTMLNGGADGMDDTLTIGGIDVDINPIRADYSGTIDEWIEDHKDYRKEEKRAAATEATGPVQSTDTGDQAYTITPTKYTTKKNKELDVWLVKFSGEIDKKKATEIAKETRGWWDREQGGFLMRSEEAARDLAERVAGATSQSDALPEPPAEGNKPTETGNKPAETGNKPAETGNKPAKTSKKPGKRSAYVEQQIDAIARELATRDVVRGTIETMPRIEDMMAPFSDWVGQYVAEHYSDMENPDHVAVLHEFFGHREWSPKENTDRTFKALSDVIKRTKEVVKQNKQAQAAASENASKPASEEPSQSAGTDNRATTNQAGPKRLVSDDRMAELKERLRKKLGGQLNVGVDPELLAIGAELAVGHIERGLTKFADYAKAMLEDVGDVIRPYLKSFYNAVRDMPEAEAYTSELTPYDEVRKFDIANFDKEGPKDVLATAKSIVDEQKVEKDVVEVTEKAKKTSKKKKKDVSSQGVGSLFDLEPAEEETNQPSKQEENGLPRTDELRSEGLPADSDNEGEPTSRLGQTPGQESRGSDRGGDSSRGGGLRENLHDGLRHADQLEGPSPKLNQNNNHAQRGKDYAPKDVDARIEANIAAIELMQKLLESGKKATPKEMSVLRKFSGWGGLGKAFNDSAYGWREDGVPNRLRKLLGEEGYQQAIDSRRSAYYTPAKVIDALWDIARALGFKGGNVLEGSAGIGNIIGLMPADMSERSQIHAVEIDGTTGNILSLLYPDAKVEIQGFQDTRVANGSIDLTITNVPFITGAHVIDSTGDKDLSKRFRDIHDFCIAKNVRKLREGGIGIFITSSGTLDNSQKLRDWLVSEGNADVVGAFRMNNTTFGGTGATSDIIVVRKRVNGQKSANAIDVSTVTGARTVDYETGEFKTVKGKQVPETKPMSLDYNRYFVEHPEMMGGEMAFAFEKGETYRETSKALYPKRGINQDERLAGFIGSLAEKDWSGEAPTQQAPTEQAAVYEELGEGVKEGSMLIDSNGKLCVASYGRAVPLDVNDKKIKGRTKQQCFKDYCAIKDAVNAVLDYQTEHDDDAGLQPLLDKLNKVFDDFVGHYGHFQAISGKPLAISFLRNDMDFSSIAALESKKEYNDEKNVRQATYTKSDIFTRRVVKKEAEPKPTTVKDGVITSIYKFGRVDVPYISEQLGKGADEVKDEIIASGLGFENPLSREVEVSYEYLSGNVREKLRQAHDNNEDGRYDTNIKALEAVIPMNIPAHLIEFTLGSSWLDPKLYSDFISERTGVKARVALIGGTWIVDVPGYYFTEQNRAMGVESKMCDKVIYGHELMAAALQNKTVRVSKTTKYRDGHSETIVDKEATQACSTKIDEIRQDFKDWAREKMQSDPDMSAQVEEVYNESFNNYVPREIPDSFVPEYFGGAARHIKLRPHQAKAAIRATTQNVMLAHEVGTGKTFTLITTAMEMRRLGTARKPMIVVQNATVGQFVASAKGLYPKAKVLTLEDADRTAEGRKAFYAKIKYNDWDMIVIPQSAFEMIPDSEERQMNFVRDKIEEKMLVLEQMAQAGMDTKNLAYKQAEREVEKLEEELNLIAGAASEKRKKRDEKRASTTRENAEVAAREMLDRKVDDVEDFDQMGIDAILVDEAHEYKHLGFATAMQRGVKGVDPSYSKKSQGVFLKCQSVMERTGGKNVVFATGTPISNTAAEIWTFMRYLYPAETLKDYGIYYFDDFVRNFGNITQMLEFATNGKFKENNRFAGYVNLPELVRIWSGVADIVRTDEASNLKDEIPEMEGGKAQDIYLPQTRALRSVMRYVNARLEEYDKMSGKEKKANSHIPLTMYGIAKAAAVDARLVLNDAEDEPNSKTNEAVRQTLRTLEETADYRGTVAIFADNYQNKESGFNLYEDIRKKLIVQGVPEDQIVVMKSGMSVKKKLEIFDKVNAGEIRVIMGSTFTLGTGVNIQERLHTLIHVDAPNRPMDYTQRNGRILRQGNLHKQMGKPVRVLRFGVEDSLDVTAYQRLKTKGAIADSIMHGKQLMSDSMANRTMEEDEDVFGDVVAQLSGSEYALLKNQAEREVRKLEAKRKQWEADQIYIHSQKPRLAGYIKASRQAKAEAEAALKALEGADLSGGITIGLQHFNSADEMGDFIKEYNKKITEDMDRIRKSFMSEDTVREMTMTIGGFDFNVRTVMARDTERRGTSLNYVTRRSMSYTCDALGLTAPVPVKQGLLRNAIEDIMENVLTGKDARERIEAAESSITRNEQELAMISEREGRPFEQADELQQARAKLKDYEQKMKAELEAKESKYAEMDASVDEAKPISVDDEDDELYREEDDADIIRQLESGPTIKVYRSMILTKDGKLLPPMSEEEESGKQRDPESLGTWYRSDERPDLVRKDGKFPLRQSDRRGKPIWAAYAPYFHAAENMLNDQFKRAQDRGDLVVVECEIPASELTSGYIAEKSKKAVGRHEWKAGDLQGQTSGTRSVYLSRWIKPVRVVPAKEQARHIYELIEGTGVIMPTNIVTPQLRAELEKMGVPFIETTNQGIVAEGEHKGEYYTKAYPMPHPEKFGFKRDLQLRDALVEGGRLAIINQGGKWRIEGMPGEFDSRYAAIDEWRERAAGNVVWYLSEDGNYIEVEGNGDMYQEIAGGPRQSRGTENQAGRARRERMARQQATRSANGRRMVDELAEKLGIKVRYVEDMSEQERAQFSERQLRSKGWYNPRTGEVFINLGRHTRLYDILSTFLHETVAHKGLRRLFGKDFNTFLDNVYNNVNKGIRAEIDRMAEQQKSRASEAQRARHDDEHWRRVATEEYMAKLAERLNLNHPEERSIWQKIRGWLINALRRAGVKFADSLSDNDLRGILWESYHNMEMEGVVGVAEGRAFRDQMEREANNRGTATAHGTSTIAAEPQAQYTGSLFDVLPQAGAWARMMSNMSERELRNEMAKDGPNVTSNYSEEYDRRHIQEYNQACDEIQAQLERELPGEDRLLELLQDAEAQWADGAYKDSRRTGVLAAIDTISRALDEERADLPRVEEDVQAEGSQYTDNAGAGLLGEGEATPYDKITIGDMINRVNVLNAKHNCDAAVLHKKMTPDEMRNALNVTDSELTDEDAEAIIKKIETGNSIGGYSALFNKILIFADNINSEVETDDTFFHERAHRFIARWKGTVTDMMSLLSEFYNDTKGKPFDRWKKEITNAYKEQRGSKHNVQEEYFVNILGKAMAEGRLDELIEPWLAERGKEIVEEYFNEINYVRAEEQPRRNAAYRQHRLLSKSKSGGRGYGGNSGGVNLSDEDLLFNDGDDGDGTIGAYNRAVNTMGKTMRVAGRDFKPRMTRYNFQEAFQDAILSVKKLQQVVCKAHGLDKLPSKEDAWTYENRLSSINMHARKHFIEKLYEPMMKAHDKLVKHGATVDEITEYVICKHGLERNQVFAERDAQRDADEIARNGGVPDIDALRDQYRQRDYSGLTSITGLDNIADIEADAQRRVDEFEQKHGQLCDELWSRINNATKWTLRRSYDGGMMSAQTYIKVRDMFQHYVPLRGWDETTAEDVYDYIMGDRGAFNGTLKAAMGRTSLADDPFATIGNMGESAIVQGNRNHLKQRLWNMATNHPTDVCKVRDMWVVLDAQGEWIADFPEIPEDADADTIAMILDDHETAMLDLESQDLAKRVRNNLDVGYRIDQRYIPEHAVVVMMNGDRHVVYINGNPRAAQAINGNLSSDKGSKNAIRRLVDFFFKDTRRYYSSVVTSYNINFSGANFVRDLPHAYAMTFTKYGWIKAAKYIVKSFQCIPWVIKNQAGYSGNSNMDQLFREFVAYGGVTGYAHINDIDSWKADNRRRMARLNALGKGTVGTLKGIKAVIHAVGWFSETLELIPRFTTYCASRDMGMDIQSSIKEAKDITTNFNKKGTEMTPGVWGAVATVLRYERMFFNPIVQGMYQWFDVANDSKAAKARLVGVMLWMPAMGALIPYLNQFLLAAIGGDDDDDYFLQNEFTRRQNMLIWTGNGYAKIPIAPVFRELYGMGETIATRMCGRIDDRKMATDFVDQLRAAFSLEGQSNYREWSFVRSAFPEQYAPIIDIINNENFTGKSLWYESEWNKTKPEYTKAKESTWSPLVNISRTINGWLGGDEDIAADKSGKWLNPVVWQHLLTNYGGGFAQVIGDASSTINNLAHGEATDVSQWPIAKRFYTQPTEKRANWARYGIYKQYEIEFNKAKDKFAALKKRGLAPLEMAKEISEFAQRHPKAVGVYASWNGGINGADYVQKLKDLREKGDDAAYWATLKEAVEKADYAMRTGYAKVWEQKRPSRPEFLDDDELHSTFDNSENDSVRAVMAKEIATRGGVQDYFSHDPYENYGDEATAYWNTYRRLRISEDVVEDGKASQLLDDNEKETLKKIKKQLGQGGDDEQIMDEYRRERRRLIEEHDNE